MANDQYDPSSSSKIILKWDFSQRQNIRNSLVCLSVIFFLFIKSAWQWFAIFISRRWKILKTKKPLIFSFHIIIYGCNGNELCFSYSNLDLSSFSGACIIDKENFFLSFLCLWMFLVLSSSLCLHTHKHKHWYHLKKKKNKNKNDKKTTKSEKIHFSSHHYSFIYNLFKFFSFWSSIFSYSIQNHSFFIIIMIIIITHTLWLLLFNGKQRRPEN